MMLSPLRICMRQRHCTCRPYGWIECFAIVFVYVAMFRNHCDGSTLISNIGLRMVCNENATAIGEDGPLH